MKALIKYLVCALLLISVLGSCKKDTDATIDAKTLKVNTFIATTMQFFYLWEDKMIPSVFNNYKHEPDPMLYFDKLLYKEKDKWSFITDDYSGLMASLSGQETTYGYSLVLYYLTKNPNTYVAVVRFVYKKSPAAKAGLKRGDIIFKINGSTITDNNYRQLVYSNTIDITLGIEEDSESGTTIVANGEPVRIIADKIYLDPIVKDTIIEYKEKKIGYLLYTQYINNPVNPNVLSPALNDLCNVLKKFDAQNIDELVLDLRYNPGGHVEAARYLCSALAPAAAVSAEKTLITKEWNKPMTEYWTSRPNTPASIFVDKFDKSLVGNGNLNLKRLYILTGKGTASASELTITGLKPYMEDIILIGDTTVGKYVASMTVQPEDWTTWQNDREINNWAVQPIVYKYVNADEESFENGFPPNHRVPDNPRDPAPLGDINERLLAKALEIITGEAPAGVRKTAQPETFTYPVIGTISSRYEKYKSNAIEQLKIESKR